MAADTTRLTIELEVLLRNLNKTLRGLDQVKRKLDSVAGVRLNQRASTTSTDRQVLAAQRLALAQQRLQSQQQRLGVQTQELANRQERARQASERLARSSTGLSQTLSRQSNVLGTAQRQLNSLGAAALRIGGGLRSLGLTASVVLTGPLVALATIATRNAVEFDSLRRGLEVMAGTSNEAAKQLERLKEIAKAPGIGFQEAIQGSIRLQAVGFSARDAEKALVQFANAVALTGGGREELGRVTVQLGQLAAKGKVVAQDLKPIIEAAPAVGQALLQAFGTVNSEDIQKLGLSSQQFFDKLTDALAKLPRAAAGARNAFENFSDSMFRASVIIGDAILPPLTKLIDFLEPIIQRIAQGFGSLPQAIQVAIIAVGALLAALGPVLFLVGGLSSGLGALATAIAAIVPILASVGLPAIAALLAGLTIVIGEIVVAVTALGLAWRTNFLGIRQLATNAATAVVNAFNRIKAVFVEAAQRILPTLQSITRKVVGAVQEVWEKYGATVTRIVSTSFKSIVQVTESFLRTFANLVDLVLKLVDGDWRGAWRAFARIVVGALDSVIPIIAVFVNAFNRGLNFLIALLIRKAVEFAAAGSRLAVVFVTALASGLVGSSSKVQNALLAMLAIAASGVALGPIAQSLVARLVQELRKAAAEGLAGLGPGPGAGLSLFEQLSGVDIGTGEGVLRKKRFTALPSTGDGSGKAERILAREADKLRQAQDKFNEQAEQNRIEIARAGIEQQFNLVRDGLDRELRALENNFEDRLTTIRTFFQKRRTLQEQEIEAEIVKEKGLSRALADEFAARDRAAQAEFQTAVKEIGEDKRLKGQARELALQTAEQNKQTALAKSLTEFESANAEVSTRILILQKQRVDVAGENVRAERELTKELKQQQDQLSFDLLDEQGRTADAESGRLRARFTETLRALRVDITGLGSDLQQALTNVDLTTLQSNLDDLPQPVRDLVELLDIGIKRAQVIEAQRLVDDLSAGLRLDETRIQARVLDGLISQRDAQAEILALQREYQGVLLDVLAGELAKAEAIKDQGQIVAIQQQIEEVKRLGVEIDTIGQQINQQLFSDLQSGISGIFSGARKGFEGLRDAAISFGERLLDTLNDVAATSIVNKLEGLLKPDATNTQGTIGGFFSKLFGLAPKQQADATAASATLQAGATTASASFATGVTTSAASFGASVITSAASFAASIIAAGATFAATVAASSLAQGIGQGAGGLGSALSGAATGLFPAVPGGVVRVVEGGYPEAVMTTDPRHAVRQVAILKAFLRETKGLGGRIKGLAGGGFALPDLTPNLISASVPNLNLSGFETGHQSSTNLRILNLLDKRQLVGGHLRSAEGARDILNVISENSDEIGRRIGIR